MIDVLGLTRIPGGGGKVMPTELVRAEAKDCDSEAGDSTAIPGGREPPSRCPSRAVAGVGVREVEAAVGGRETGEANASDSKGVVKLSLPVAEAFGRLEVAEYRFESISSVSGLRRVTRAVEHSELL